MSAPRVTAVLVPNGLGHVRRTVGVLARYLERGGEATVTLVAEDWQQRAAARWPAGRFLEHRGARWCTGVMAPGVHWTLDPSVYEDGRLLAWEDRLAEVREVEEADVVLSDNLVGVLSVRSDALLMASFLWCDVLGDPGLERTADLAAFVEHEHGLLASHRPEMLCVASLAMPGVVERTRAVPVGWMCSGEGAWRAHRPVDAAPGEDEVVVLGGWTGAADAVLVEAARALSQAGIRVTAAAGLAGRAGVPPFDPTSERWARVAAAVCRPGAGTLTDCIEWQVPIVCVDEGTNAELRHNAAQVEALGLGVDAGAHAPSTAVVGAVRRVLETERRRDIRDRMGAVDRAGLDQAADWLAVHCGTCLAPPSV